MRDNLVRQDAPYDSNRIPAAARNALVMLALVSLLNFYDRTLVAVISQPLRAEFHLSDTEYGLISGPAYVAIYAVATILFGWLADRSSRRRIVLILALAGWSLMTAASGLVTSFAMLVLARAAMGAGEGASNPLGVSILSDYFVPARRSFALAVFFGGGMVGIFLSFTLGSTIAAHFGWRAVFLVAGLPGLVLAAAMALGLREPPRGRHDSIANPLPYGTLLRRLSRNRAYFWLNAAISMTTFSTFGVMVWFPQFFIRYHHLTTQQVGLLFGPAAALGLLSGTFFGGWMGNRLARRALERPLLLCVVVNLAIVPIYLVVFWTESLPIGLVGTFVGMALAASHSPNSQAAMQNVCSPYERGTAVALNNLAIALIGQGLLSFLVGLISDHLKPEMGTEALRWALSVSTLYALVAAGFFALAMFNARRQYAGMARGTSAAPDPV